MHRLLSPLGPQKQRGNIMAFALILVAGIGAVLAVISQRNVNEKRRMLKTQSSESTLQVNLNNLNVLQAVMQFPGSVAPSQQTADNPNYVPAVFPDPYINPSGAPVALRVFSQTPNAARWSANGSGGLTFYGFNPAAIPASDMNNLFTQGSPVASNAPYALTSTVTYNGVKLQPGLPLITSVNIQSTSSLAKSTGMAQNAFNADIALPVPPPPVIVASVVPSSPVGVNQQFQVTVWGYGLMTAASISAGGGQSITLNMPSAAGSIQNTIDGGFNLGTYTLTATEVDAPTSPPSAGLGIFYVNLNATGPGGPAQTTQADITVATPPSCSFSQPTYNITAGSSGLVSMNTVGAQSAAIFDPFQSAWVNGSAATLSPPSTASGAYTNIQGSVTGAGGLQATCTYNVDVAAAPAAAPPPSGTPICWDHGYQYDIPLNVWYGGGPALAYYAQAGYCNEYGSQCVPPVYYYFQAIFLNPDPSHPGDCTGLICANLTEYAPLGSCASSAYFRDDGCFPPETKLRLADGTARRIDRLRDSDQLYNPLTGGSAGVKKVVKGPEALPLLEIGYGGLVVHVTTKHAFLTPTGVRIAKQLRLGDEIFGSDGLIHAVERYEQLPLLKDQQVYNVELDTSRTDPAFHALEADGILTGDLYLQQHPNSPTN